MYGIVEEVGYVLLARVFSSLDWRCLAARVQWLVTMNCGASTSTRNSFSATRTCCSAVPCSTLWSVTRRPWKWPMTAALWPDCLPWQRTVLVLCGWCALQITTPRILSPIFYAINVQLRSLWRFCHTPNVSLHYRVKSRTVYSSEDRVYSKADCILRCICGVMAREFTVDLSRKSVVKSVNIWWSYKCKCMKVITLSKFTQVYGTRCKTENLYYFCSKLNSVFKMVYGILYLLE